MPLIESSYSPPLFWRNGQLSTIYNGLIKKVHGVIQKRQRITLSDGDFLDLDWSYSETPTNKLIVLVHGLEGDAQRTYILGAARSMNLNGYNCCAINLRGCSGETNQFFRSYHSGATQDLHEVLLHINEAHDYSEIILKGFSLGGNLILRYLGEAPSKVPENVKAAIGVSVPCDLHDCQKQLHRAKNLHFATHFLRKLKSKLWLKLRQFPDKISLSDIRSIKTLKDFDDVYTSKANGFENAEDYYRKCSCISVLTAIDRPTLLINAKNDSFLGDKCYPHHIAEQSTYLHFETPKYGGHVGFWGKNGMDYTQKRTLEFIHSF